MQVKALACELPAESGVPLSRFSCEEIAREVMARGIAAKVSGATVWRWLGEDCIRPWQYRSWISPRAPDFEEKGGRVLDLYQRRWEGKELGGDEYVISADEKTSIQARKRTSRRGARPKQPLRVENDYERRGAVAYVAGWDVGRAKIFGRCEPTTGIAPFARFMAEVMGQEPYRSARRVFWIVDNGSSHRGQASVERARKAWPSVVMVHLPVHASWLNQIEIYFSVVQRKVLTPNDFGSVQEVEDRLLAFQDRYESAAKPFEWKFTRQDLRKLLAKLSTPARSSVTDSDPQPTIAAKESPASSHAFRRCA